MLFCTKLTIESSALLMCHDDKNLTLTCENFSSSVQLVLLEEISNKVCSKTFAIFCKTLAQN